jgi:hypothetical protein
MNYLEVTLAFLTPAIVWTSMRKNLEGEIREPSIQLSLLEGAPGGSHEVS